jgi:ATP-dependent DNA helicase RecG
MSENPLFYELAYLKGVGPQRASWLESELGLKTFYDLLAYFPYKYLNRTEVLEIGRLEEGPAMVQTRGKLVRFERWGQGPSKRLTATLLDGRDEIELVWFQALKWAESSLTLGEEYLVFGKVTRYKGQLQISHPELTRWSEWVVKGGPSMSPMYSISEKLRQRGINNKAWQGMIRHALDQVKGYLGEIIPQMLVESEGLMGRHEAMVQVHFPVDTASLQAALRRFKFEELFFLQFGVLRIKSQRQLQSPGVVFGKVGEHFLGFYRDRLPFKLTEAQMRVLKEIRADLKSGTQMNRLLQGDVGSGKTLVALMTMLLAVDNGYQACLMAPTELLARQHLESIRQLLGDMPVRCALLTGQVKGQSRKAIVQDLYQGTLHLVIGTHALLENEVRFASLGLAVIDEQHRFGVEQRSKLWSKATLSPHVLVMTATPIPRTLAMTRYGDLDVSVMNQLPFGRKPIRTLVTPEAKRLKMFAFLEQQMGLGRQVYVVYPAIQETEKAELKFLYDGYEAMLRAFPPPRFTLAVVHGQMKGSDRDMEMKRFAQGVANLLVATTVIEVGVNVPNATVMVVENAERFGLAQLHQLRGRVGRGSEQSYCILMHKDQPSREAMARLDALASTNDGFRIAELDLQLRGPGDMSGTQQSGTMELKFADLSVDQELLARTRDHAERILEGDPQGTGELTGRLVLSYSRFYGRNKNWSKIS